MLLNNAFLGHHQSAVTGITCGRHPAAGWENGLNCCFHQTAEAIEMLEGSTMAHQIWMIELELHGHCVDRRR